jgi:carbon-monoxide dehydrogenase medium subunit
MSEFEYLRPKTIKEAVGMLQRGVPLAGGTRVSTKRRQIEAAIDLGGLGLTDITIENDTVVIEAGVRLQSIVESELPLPEALKSACRLEAGWNIRNAATLGGAIMAEDGRSPLLTCLQALEAEVTLEPGGTQISLAAFFESREQRSEPQLLTHVQFAVPQSLAYDQVARSPMDRPIVCVAVGRIESQAGERYITIAIGGFGKFPVRAGVAEQAALEEKALESVVDMAAEVYGQAEDAWASAEYRSAVVGVLVRRLLANGGA